MIKNILCVFLSTFVALNSFAYDNNFYSIAPIPEPGTTKYYLISNWITERTFEQLICARTFDSYNGASFGLENCIPLTPQPIDFIALEKKIEASKQLFISRNQDLYNKLNNELKHAENLAKTGFRTVLAGAFIGLIGGGGVGGALYLIGVTIMLSSNYKMGLTYDNSLKNYTEMIIINGKAPVKERVTPLLIGTYDPNTEIIHLDNYFMPDLKLDISYAQYVTALNQIQGMSVEELTEVLEWSMKY